MHFFRQSFAHVLFMVSVWDPALWNMSLRECASGNHNAGPFWDSLCHNENSCEEFHEPFESALLCCLRCELVSLLIFYWSARPTDFDAIVPAKFRRASHHHPARCTCPRPHERTQLRCGGKPIRNRAQ